jgi:site-specific DNA recombinase
MISPVPLPPARFPRPTCVGYCRVSTREQADHGWSIEQQEDAIRSWAANQGLDVVAVFRDAGRSGRSMQHRPGLLAMLELIHHGGIGVVVAKAPDRLARAVDHSLGLRQWINRHGADLLFLDGDLHLRATDPAGGAHLGADLLASLTAVLAEEEIATLRRRIIPNIVAAAQNGRRGGRVPLGYRRQADGTIQVDPHDAVLVQRAVAAVLAGQGLSQLSRRWVAEGVRGSDGAIISFDRLRGALTNRFMSGELHYRLPPEAVTADTPSAFRIPAHHPVLIDPVTFDRLQRLLARPGSASVTSAAAATPAAAGAQQGAERRRERRRAQRLSQRLPASGDLIASLQPATRPVHGAIGPAILRCGTCGASMYASLATVGAVGKRSQRASYICRYHKDRGAAFCAQPPVPVEVIDDAVFAAVQGQMRTWSLASPNPPAAETPAGATQDAVATAAAQRDRLQATVTQLGSRAPAVLIERLATATADLERLQMQAQRREGNPLVATGPGWDFRQRPQATWEALDAAGRRSVLTPLLAAVTVRGKSVTSVSIRQDDGRTQTVQVATAQPAEVAS